MEQNPYQLLARRLDALPNGFPATQDGVELRLLEKLFTPDEALLAAQLRLTPETAEVLAPRLADLGYSDPQILLGLLKQMTRKGLIEAKRTEAGLAFKILPFVVGIYENQAGRLDADLAFIFEDYYKQAFGQAMNIQPSVHRVVPVRQNIRNDMEVQPYESASDILRNAQAWGVLDCICRTQKALIGQPCEHPLDNCMILNKKPGVFDNHPVIRALTLNEALDKLEDAAKAGLVHSVSNSQEDTTYICNCCTCSCGILRGMSELGIANAIARSPFVNLVDEELCVGCEDCLAGCQFNALSMLAGIVQVNQLRCLGCGICVQLCNGNALSLIRRPDSEIQPIPVNDAEWRQERAIARNMNLESIL